MTQSSFKWRGGSPPRHYRTPSPPAKFHEPITPTASKQETAQALPRPAPHEHTNSNYPPTNSYYHDGQSLPGREREGSKKVGLDVFASIALAANGTPRQNHYSTVTPKQSSTSNSLPDSLYYNVEYNQSVKERDAREIGSAGGGDTRLKDHFALETRKLEAELLLSFSREAYNAIPRSSPTLRRPSTSRVENHPFHGAQQAALPTLPPAQHSFAQSQDQQVQYSQNDNHQGKHSSSPTFAATNPSHPSEYQPNHSSAKSQDNDTTRERTNEAEKSVPNGLGLEGLGYQQMPSVQSCEVLMELEKHLQDEPQSKPQTAQASEELPAATTIGAKQSTPEHTDPAVAPDLSTKVVAENGIKVVTEGIISPPKPAETKLLGPSQPKPKHADSPSICASCNFSRNSIPGENEADSTSWISCDGCRKWFHFACAGFRSEREVRAVDKYRCKVCKPIHGPTTYVRKSSRAHSAIDYAGLNEGVIKTSDEDPEHHYVKDFKNGKKFTPETFARMRPELVTADFFRRGDGMKEPVLIPAAFNPTPRQIPDMTELLDFEDQDQEFANSEILHDRSILDSWLPEQFEYETVENEGQDALDMVIPRDLTVRKVSELYGPDEKIEVIDVKSQNGEDKRWTMKRWVDYYESAGDKVVRNVISLEVSQSKLGRLIRRPKIVRDLDLQDAVWPADLVAKGEFPKVQFYCLMSVADCYTDFHIDFGGSSVYYHILKGKKTFFFIPPHEKHLKKYEEWCNSPAQNWTFLGDQTKECYRVDLSQGDTMLIPAGWIHAVWTPEDSLVIGGNFLTPLHYPLQIRVAQIEKATNVARKFRYPHFQKVLWYAAFHYMDEDPTPENATEQLVSGQPFSRPPFSIYDCDSWGEASPNGAENYQARYYGRAELDGLPELCRYLLRTALIAMGSLTDGISVETRNAVKRSIPKGHNHGEPLEAIKKFAVWCAWKRGNETIPFWAYPAYVPESAAVDQSDKKLSVKARRKLDREAAYQAFKIAPDRQSTRARAQPQNLLAEIAANQNSAPSSKKSTPTPTTDPTLLAKREPEATPTVKRKIEEVTPNGQNPENASTPSKKVRLSSGSKTGSARRPACEACRKSRRACKHRDDPLPSAQSSDVTYGSIVVSSSPTKPHTQSTESLSPRRESTGKTLSMLHVEIAKSNMRPPIEVDGLSVIADMPSQVNGGISIAQLKAHGRTKACKDCRKSKRRCVHDEFGNEDPVKLAEAAIPRPAAKRKKTSISAEESPPQKKQHRSSLEHENSTAAPAAARGSSPIQLPPTMVPETHSSNQSVVELTQPEENGFIPIPVDPELLAQSTNAPPSTQPPVFCPDDEVNLIATSPLSDVKCEPLGDDLHVIPTIASSLVSPPDSTHAEEQRTPPALLKLNGFTPPTTSASSRQSSHPAKQQGARYTPESGPLRRPSSSSGGAFTRESHSPTVSVGAGTGSHRRKSRTSSVLEADEESLKLIRELQAQDLGLRRRGRT